MKAQRTIERQLRAIRYGLQVLAPANERAFDQAYGAAEALRWVLDQNSPPPVGLTKPFTSGVPQKEE